MSGLWELFDRTPDKDAPSVIQRWPADAREILKGQPERFSRAPWPAEAQAEPEVAPVDAGEPDNDAPRRGRQRREASS